MSEKRKGIVIVLTRYISVSLLNVAIQFQPRKDLKKGCQDSANSLHFHFPLEHSNVASHANSPLQAHYEPVYLSSSVACLSASGYATVSG